MKASKWILALAMIGSVHIASADTCNSCPSFNTCDPCDPCGEWSYTVYGDLLYWDVRRTDLDYGGGSNKRKYVNPDYDFGFRLGGILYCDCWDYGIRWTSYDQSDSTKDNQSDKK